MPSNRTKTKLAKPKAIKRGSRKIVTIKKFVSKKRPIVLKKRGKRGDKHTPVLLKLPANPILAPKTENEWEAWQTFNPGVVLLEDKIHFLYRAIGKDYLSRFGHAMSSDGFKIDERLPYPVYEHKLLDSLNFFYSASGGSFGGCEDPRAVRVGEENTLYMTYTACNGGLRMALTSIDVQNFLNKRWRWKPPVMISPPGEIHKNWLIFPEKINGKYAFLLSIAPEIEVDYFDNLDFDGKKFINSTRAFGAQKNSLGKSCWDKWLRGPGAVPIKTKDGWLLFYHAMDNDWSKYKVGAMLLDLGDPTKVLYRAKEPILEPSEDYENNGYKGGVIYVSGAVVKNGELLVYYGAADSFVGIAYANLEDFLSALKQGKKTALSVRQLKNKK